MFREYDFTRLGVSYRGKPAQVSIDFDDLWRRASDLANERVREALERSGLQKLQPPDCGDNSCYFAKERGGMRTNGGCRCSQNHPKEVERYARQLRMIAEANALLIENLKLEIRELRSGIGWGRAQESDQNLRNCLATAWEKANRVMSQRGEEPPV